MSLDGQGICGLLDPQALAPNIDPYFLRCLWPPIACEDLSSWSSLPAVGDRRVRRMRASQSSHTADRPRRMSCPVSVLADFTFRLHSKIGTIEVDSACLSRVG